MNANAIFYFISSFFISTQVTDISKAHGTPHPPSSQQEDQDHQVQHQLTEQQHLLEGGERRQDEEVREVMEGRVEGN